VLIVGAGPAGLECAQALGNRGYEVRLVEASRELGGRVCRESRLAGLAEWARVRDWRVSQIGKMPNVSVYRESAMTAADVLDTGAPIVVIATGASWRRDGFGRNNWKPMSFDDSVPIFTPDDVMDGARIEGPAVVFDDDDYYMGGVVAETLRARGVQQVSLVTPNALASAWTVNTLEQQKIQKRLLELDVAVVANANLRAARRGELELACMFTNRLRTMPVKSLVLVTARLPKRKLFDDLERVMAAMPGHGIRLLARIGDCITPGTIAWAVFEGRKFAEELDQPARGHLSVLTEVVDLADTTAFRRRHEGRTRPARS
jgi:dimethylamine/trimethylamine dehydrogenase